MKKTKINLLSDRQDYTRLERYFSILRISVLVYASVLFLVVGIISIFLFNQGNQMQSLNDRKKTFLTSISLQKEDEAKLIYISKKMDAYEQFIKEDAQFLPYFTLLNNTLKTSSPSGSLSSFVIDKNRDVTFVLAFNGLEEMLQSFQFVESEQFLKNFEELLLTQFLSQKQNTTQKYELSFEGKFIELQ